VCSGAPVVGLLLVECYTLPLERFTGPNLPTSWVVSSYQIKRALANASLTDSFGSARDLLECMLHLAIRIAASGQKSRIPASRIGLSTGYFSSLRLLASTTVWVRCIPSPEGVAETCQVPWTATHVPSTVATRRCFGSTCNTT